MEKKTIGALIAVLRKANGMTQRELAERLSVSDKAVSRWERDECAPDLSLIPVIADLFGITTDELLRGERRTGSDTENAAGESPWCREKSARQLRHLMDTKLTRLRERGMIALGILAGGYITALICNFAFNHAELGFFLSLVFYVTAVIWELIHLRRSSLGEDEAFDEEKRAAYQNGVTLAGRRFFRVLWLTLGATVPFLFVTAMTSFTPAGLTFPAYALLTLIMVLLFLVVWHFAEVFAIFPKLVERRLITVSEQAVENNRKRRRLLFKTAVIAVSIALVLAIIGIALAESAEVFSETHRFDDYESFKTFMETPMEYDGDKLISYQPVDGEEISDEYWPRRTVRDHSGNIVCEYIDRNEAVAVIRFSFDESEDGLPIYVITSDQYRMSEATGTVLMTVCLVLAAADLVIAACIYWKKSKKYA
ncbi:MAG: helix-turn-helix domain-containing protein [Clostridia bacterium]|nr:helix-turn-helix domain-containing protein [Clostridia bacterium]